MGLGHHSHARGVASPATVRIPYHLPPWVAHPVVGCHLHGTGALPSESSSMNPGSIVRCRNRDWVLLPSDDRSVRRLRPLAGATDEVVALHERLADLVGMTLAPESIRSSLFPPPTVNDLADASSAHLLWQAARLTLREGATPFRSLGRISIRPRIYQLVPILMALRLDPVRLLIADDVGVGKTIEALLIARELMDRGEIKRLCVLCPPYLCDQWHQELCEKFNLDAVIIRSGTVGQLERRRSGSESIYQHYPIQVTSIDFVKSDRNRHQFLLHCPELVIVDEGHGSALTSKVNLGQHQRNQLVRELADETDRHLILLTATPHSGIEDAFRSLLSLLRPEFGEWDTASLTDGQRIELARHFVQRTRRDIENEWEGDHCFPTRESADETYRLSKSYRDLFARTYDFCSEIVQEGQRMDRWRQRVRYWGALALLRSVMSSPAAAVAALASRHDALATDDDEPDFRSFVFEGSDDRTDDDHPTPPMEAAEATMAEGDRRRLRDLGRAAAAMLDSPDDMKLARCAELVSGLLRDGFQPIIWCRFIATAEYVAQGLVRALGREHEDLRIVAITSRTGDDEERRIKLAELSEAPRRVLVATDCLSEGINLQEHFNAVLHYDLPWNPNRLEQREGRVDRYGQKRKLVKAIRYFSPDNPVDGVVLDVLLNKAREIHRALGTHVPVPEESETVTQAVLQALFLRGRRGDSGQLMLDFGPETPAVQALHQKWSGDAERERVNRTRFAQRALKPAEVRRELEATDDVLGDPDAVREFVLNAAQRLGLSITPIKGGKAFRVAVGPEACSALPAAISAELPAAKSGHWIVSFTSPTPEGAAYLGRNHRFVAALARYLMEEALTSADSAVASRCGVIRTHAVSRLTTILLLRIRYLVQQPERPPLLSEEVLVKGLIERDGGRQWLPDAEALKLLAEARPGANVPMAEKRQLAQLVLNDWRLQIEPALHEPIQARAAELEQSHKRVRQAVSLRIRELKVEPQFPPDLLGLFVLQPMV